MLKAKMSRARVGMSARTDTLTATQWDFSSQTRQTGSETSPHQWYQHREGFRKLEAEK